jgi:hypothetical protein
MHLGVRDARVVKLLAEHTQWIDVDSELRRVGVARHFE